MDSEIGFGLPSWRLEALRASKLSSLKRFRPPKEPLWVFGSYGNHNISTRVHGRRRFFLVCLALHRIRSSLLICSVSPLIPQCKFLEALLLRRSGCWEKPCFGKLGTSKLGSWNALVLQVWLFAAPGASSWCCGAMQLTGT